jgi:hypothetical protein
MTKPLGALAAALAMTLAPLHAVADRIGVQFEVQVKRGAKVVHASSPIALYGQAVSVETPREAKVEAYVEAPARDGRSKIAARFYVFDGKQMKVVKELTLVEDLGKAPTIVYEEPGKPVMRFSVKSRITTLKGV